MNLIDSRLTSTMNPCEGFRPFNCAQGRPFARVKPCARRAQEGQATVEIAFLLPILMVLLYGIIAAGFMFYAFITVSNAARDAARAGSVYRLTRAASGLTLEETVENAVYDPGSGRSSLGFLSTAAPNFDVASDVAISWVDVDADSRESVGDQLTVSVTYRYTLPILSDFFVPMFQEPIVIVRDVTLEIQ